MYFEEDIELCINDLLELLFMSELVPVQLNEVPSLSDRKAIQRSVYVRTFTMIFHCGYVKGKYHCFLQLRELVLLHIAWL